MNESTQYSLVLSQLEGGAMACGPLRQRLYDAEARLREAQVPCYIGPESRQTLEDQVYRYRCELQTRLHVLFGLWSQMMRLVTVGENRHIHVGEISTRDEIYNLLSNIAGDVGLRHKLSCLVVEYDNTD